MVTHTHTLARSQALARLAFDCWELPSESVLISIKFKSEAARVEYRNYKWNTKPIYSECHQLSQLTFSFFFARALALEWNKSNAAWRRLRTMSQSAEKTMHSIGYSDERFRWNAFFSHSTAPMTFFLHNSINKNFLFAERYQSMDIDTVTQTRANEKKMLISCLSISKLISIEKKKQSEESAVLSCACRS